MSIEDNKRLVRRFIEELLLAGRQEAADEIVAPDFTAHTWPTTGPGPDGMKQAMQRMSGALRDVSMSIDEIIAEGDRVAVRLTSRATPTGDFMGVPAAGKPYEISEMHIFGIRDGRVAEHWHVADFLTMMRQFGAVPGGAGAS